jgi:hypothetical protein
MTYAIFQDRVTMGLSPTKRWLDDGEPMSPKNPTRTLYFRKSSHGRYPVEHRQADTVTMSMMKQESQNIKPRRVRSSAGERKINGIKSRILTLSLIVNPKGCDRTRNAKTCNRKPTLIYQHVDDDDRTSQWSRQGETSAATGTFLVPTAMIVPVGTECQLAFFAGG